MKKLLNKKIAELVVILGYEGFLTSQNEIHEALKDMSKRPTPDITGSFIIVKHAFDDLDTK